MSASPVQAGPEIASENDAVALAELTTVSRPARLKKPIPAGSSRAQHSSDQSDWPSETRLAGSSIPAPSSLTVMTQASSRCSAEMAIVVAPARRAVLQKFVKNVVERSIEYAGDLGDRLGRDPGAQFGGGIHGAELSCE